MAEIEQTPTLTLKQWVNRVYVRSSMVQLVMVSSAFLILLLGAFFLLGLNQNDIARKDHEQQLISALQAKTDWVNARLASVQSNLLVFQRQTERIIASPNAFDATTPLVFSRQNVLMKPNDDGGVAVYYSTQGKDLSAREEKTRKLLPLSPLIVDIQRANPLVKQAYVNTLDSLNLLYPFQDVEKLYPSDLNTKDFSFFYLANEENNPKRQRVWTDAYIDPAGLGWIISNIAPVYKADHLEAVVGLDLTIDTLINNLFNLPLPWSGYGVLIGKDGNILALPQEGEIDFGLNELTQDQYSFRHATDNQFKPELLNLYKQPELAVLSRLIAHQQAGLAQIQLSQPSVVAWNTVPSTGWKLLAITPQAELYTNTFSEYLKDLTLLVLLFVLIIVVIHIALQRFLSQRLYTQLQRPLDYFYRLIDSVIHDDKKPPSPLSTPVIEIQKTADLIHSLSGEIEALKRSSQQESSNAQQQRDFLRNLLNSLPMPVFNTDGEYRIQGCNHAFALFFGRNENDLKGHLLTELIPVTPSDSGVCANGMYTKELILTNASEQNRHMSIMITGTSESLPPQPNHKGLSLIGIMVDTSDHYHEKDQLKFDRDRALEASKLQNEYLQAMHQELEKPLLNLANLTEQLSAQPEEHKRLGLLIKEQTDALLFIAKDNKLSEPQSSLLQQNHRESQPHVLVVDDGAVNTMLAKSVLQKVGYDVDVVSSGQDALEQMTKKHYQVVLMDIFMPEMDGIETTRHWREREKNMNLAPAAIIALTANVLESERQRFFDAGMNEYLAKPYHPSTLRSRVDHWRQQYEMGQVPT
ncbi:response regulator [Oceanospirillum maris]|jgi:CheY-like chemotaxis protein/PAS domain-containing protein|uniref:response regulator n=1 Tax=Oceanospirillum maris TaxID=64977 RepID=UPI00040309E2|nr:response regulator [Oceanospirillum maris]